MSALNPSFNIIVHPWVTRWYQNLAIFLRHVPFFPRSGFLINITRSLLGSTNQGQVRGWFIPSCISRMENLRARNIITHGQQCIYERTKEHSKNENADGTGFGAADENKAREFLQKLMQIDVRRWFIRWSRNSWRQLIISCLKCVLCVIPALSRGGDNAVQYHFCSPHYHLCPPGLSLYDTT